MEHKCQKTDIKTIEKCELTRDEIIKALECCASADTADACRSGCPLFEKGDDCVCIFEPTALHKYALSLIKELTEENERVQKQLDDRCDRCIEIDKARTVKEMTDLLIRRLPIISPSVFRGIANEMLEGV